MDLTAKYQWKRVKMRTDLVPTQPWQTRASMKKEVSNLIARCATDPGSAILLRLKSGI